VAGTDAKHQAENNGVPSRRRSRWWLPVLTFVLGIAGGVLIVGLLDTSTPDFSAERSASPATPSPAGSQQVPAEGGARVNAACVRVINEARDVATILSEVGPAITSVNLQQLDDIVRRLQSIQGRLDNDLRDCRVEAEVSGTPSTVPSASPPEPSASSLEPSASPIPLPTASPTR
jgi:hypothetical protein